MLDTRLHAKHFNPTLQTAEVTGNSLLTEFALMTGLDESVLQRQHTLASPAGLLCRLELEEDRTPSRARAHVLLPMSCAEFWGAQTASFLTLQRDIVDRFNWLLTCDGDGQLELRSPNWHTQAQALEEDLLFGVAIGVQAYSRLDAMDLEGAVAGQDGSTP
jgi:hypothetical protein